MEPHRGEGLDVRRRRHTGFVEIAFELAAHDVVLVERPDRPQHLDLLVEHRLLELAGGWLHRQDGDDVEQMVLHHVADRAHFLVELAAALDAEVLGHRDLHALDEVAVPDRLEEGIGEAEIQQVLHRFLAEIMIDPEDLVLVKYQMQHAIEPARGGEIASERLLDHQTGAVGGAGLLEALHHRLEHAGRDREVMERVPAAVQCIAQALEGRRDRDSRRSHSGAARRTARRPSRRRCPRTAGCRHGRARAAGRRSSPRAPRR